MRTEGQEIERRVHTEEGAYRGGCIQQEGV